MRGKKARLNEGKIPQGTGFGIYGYDWNRDTKRREIKSNEAQVVQQIFNKVVMGESLVSIARGLNQHGIPTKAAKYSADKRTLWHSLTIRRMIHNSSYIGKTYFSNTLLPDITPPIVSEEVFNMANAELDKPKVRTGRPKHDYLLRHHSFCSICGKPLVGHCLNKKYRYYQCSSAKPHENNKQTCTAKYIRADNLEDIVWNKTREVLSNPDIILKEIQKQIDDTESKVSLGAIEAKITELKKNLYNYKQRRSNLLKALEMGEFDKDEVLDRLNNLKRLRREDEAKLNGLVQMRDNLNSLANAKIKLDQLYNRVIENLNHCTPDLKRLALDALDVKVYASNDSIEIQGVIPLELPTTARTSGCMFIHNKFK